jgi:hypothetical protein
MKTLDFEKVGEVVVQEQPNDSHDHSKLFTIFDSILFPIPGDNYCFYYNNTDVNEDVSLVVDDYSDSQNDSHIANDVDEDNKSLGSHVSGELKQSNFYNPIYPYDFSDLESTRAGYTVPAPIFVRFLLNDGPLSADDLNRIENGSKFSVLVSVFKDVETQQTSSLAVNVAKLPSTHLTSAAVLSSLLNAYVAEQTLERLRFIGSNLQESDIGQAKICLRNARNILSCKVDVFFYSRNSDTIIKVSEQQITGLEMEEAFDLLLIELGKCKSFTLKSYGTTGFLLLSFEKENDILAYWCFLKIQRTSGMVSVEMFHPAGLDQAQDLMQLVIDDVTTSCHRVNQFLLLLSLNNTRIASRLLIPDGALSPSDKALVDGQMACTHFQDGHFECPIVYQTSFDLFHRFTSNPMKVVVNLQEHVLHNFAVSNRPEIFVYKDESGSIFYMKLTIQQPRVAAKDDISIEGSGCINLLVYGIAVPGPSITVQLRKLLHKRLLTIAVDMLSSVLTKNPRYHWRQPDIRFVKCFRAQTIGYDDDKLSVSIDKTQRTYSFPASTTDPGMVALFFRQNICGSTYFHPLSTSEWESSWIKDDPADLVSDDILQLQPTDLVFYYNTSSSDLDPSLQSESTLTSKGVQYSRQIGTGLAIIEVSLLNREGQPLQKMKAAIPSRDAAGVNLGSLNALTFDEAENKFDVMENEFDAIDKLHEMPLYIRINIADTGLKTDTLHEWVLLSLNQALMAWNIERQLERIQNGLLTTNDLPSSNGDENERKSPTENICFGLPTFARILELAQKLPDPTALQTEYFTVVRSSIVATMTLDLLEKVILDQIQTEVRSKVVVGKHYKLVTVRSTRSSSPQIVKLERDDSGKVVARGLTGKANHPSVLIDSPIDCPEYTCFFYSTEYYDELSQFIVYPKLFKEVAVGYEKSGEKGDFAKSLFDFKRQHLPFFRRSIAFIYTVKRNRRSLLAYNWSPSLFKRTAKRLSEIEHIFHRSTAQSVQLLQHRSLGLLAPIANINHSTKSTLKDTASKAIENETVRTDHDRFSGARQSSIPPSIRRPKLVGKSIEGSAIQAVAKSRARASATRFRGIAQSNTPKTIQRKHSSSKIDVKSASNTEASFSKNAGTNTGARNTETDETNMFRKEFDKIVNNYTLSQSANQSIACQQLTKMYWPLTPTMTISHSLANSLFVLAPIAWIDVCAMLPFPKSQMNEFLKSFGSTIATFIPGLSPVIIRETVVHDTFWLMGNPRRLKNCRAFVIIKISDPFLERDGRKDVLVQLEGRFLSLPRKVPHKTQAMIENGSAGLDKLSSDIHKLLGLQVQLLDHCAYVIERTIKSSTNKHDYCDVASVLRPLIDLFPLRKMVKTIRSNYKVISPKLYEAQEFDFQLYR